MKNSGFTPEERADFTTWMDASFVDSYRHFYPDEKGAYTFWSNMGGARARNIGWRIDYYIISKRFMPNIADSIIRSPVLGSDHCPIVLLMNTDVTPCVETKFDKETEKENISTNENRNEVVEQNKTNDDIKNEEVLQIEPNTDDKKSDSTVKERENCEDDVLEDTSTGDKQKYQDSTQIVHDAVIKNIEGV